MQRSSTSFARSMWNGPSLTLLLTNSMFVRRQMADYSSKKNQLKRGSSVTKDESLRSNRTDLSTPRHIVREENMWEDSQKMDTKWLRSQDPWCYKPDFRQTEPQSLRKQFMRTLDERTRDAMNMDSEKAVSSSAYMHRQEFIAKQKRDQEEAQTEAGSKIQRKQPAKGVNRNNPRNTKK